MTASTEQERAEFEAAFIAEKLRLIDCGESESGAHAVRSVHLKRNEEAEYPSLEAHFAWWAWQAARRAPVVPNGWKLVPDADNMTDEQAEAVAEIARVCGGGALDIYRAVLAAAPQPPEAA